MGNSTSPAAAAPSNHEARLDAIVRSAMDAIITVDATQCIVLFNAAAEALFRCRAEDMLGRPLDALIPERFRTVHRAHIAHFAQTGETARRMGMQGALWALRADGSEFPIEASISQASAGGERFLTVIVRDIGERIRVQAELLRAQEGRREGEARLEAIVRSAMDAIVALDADQRIVFFNAAAEEMFGCRAAEALGGTLDRFLPERFRATHRAHVERFARTGITSRRMGMQGALWALRADGSEFPIEASISYANVAGRLLLTVILRDVSARLEAERQVRRAHQELRDLSAAMLEVREAERTRIARELHDDLGQALTALKMDADLLEAALPPQRADLTEQVHSMRRLLDAMVVTTRRISADLRPLVLDDLGLGAAAEWLVQNVVQRAGVECDLRIDPACAGLGEPHASALFRIMQEALTNVTRHARAQHVEVRLERAGDEAVLAVRDDGVGMDRAARPKPTSFGLRGIRERVLLLGGDLAISSRPGVGTMLSARIPLRSAARSPPA